MADIINHCVGNKYPQSLVEEYLTCQPYIFFSIRTQGGYQHRFTGMIAHNVGQHLELFADEPLRKVEQLHVKGLPVGNYYNIYFKL